MEIITITLIGFVAGLFGAIIPIIGGLAFNILTTSLVLSYQQLTEVVNALPMLPQIVLVSSIAFSVGVFTIRFLSVLPIPYIQQMAQMLKGGN